MTIYDVNPIMSSLMTFEVLYFILYPYFIESIKLYCSDYDLSQCKCCIVHEFTTHAVLCFIIHKTISSRNKNNIYFYDRKYWNILPNFCYVFWIFGKENSIITFFDLFTYHPEDIYNSTIKGFLSNLAVLLIFNALKIFLS